MPPKNLPAWVRLEDLQHVDGVTALGRELRAGYTMLSPAALKQLAEMLPERSGLAQQQREQRLAELDAAEAELDRQRDEIHQRRTELRGQFEEKRT